MGDKKWFTLDEMFADWVASGLHTQAEIDEIKEAAYTRPIYRTTRHWRGRKFVTWQSLRDRGMA